MGYVDVERVEKAQGSILFSKLLKFSEPFSIYYLINKKLNLAICINWLYSFLGKEFRALFISTVRTRWTCWQIEDRNVQLNSNLSELDFGFLSDERLLNTAMTRAQSLLAVVGDPMSLCSIGACKEKWKQYLHRCHVNKGLYGCTLKSVMDFCVSQKVLNPNAHEFTPGRAEEDNQTLLNPSLEGTKCLNCKLKVECVSWAS